MVCVYMCRSHHLYWGPLVVERLAHYVNALNCWLCTCLGHVCWSALIQTVLLIFMWSLWIKGGVVSGPCFSVSPLMNWFCFRYPAPLSFQTVLHGEEVEYNNSCG